MDTTKPSIIRWMLLLLFLCLPRRAEFFTIEKSYGQNHNEDLLVAKSTGFQLGQFKFDDAVHRFTNASSILSVVASCVEHQFAEFAVLKFLSVKNLNLVEAAAVSIADTNSEALSHVLNGCTPTWKGFDNGMKELLYHVSMVLSRSPLPCLLPSSLFCSRTSIHPSILPSPLSLALLFSPVSLRLCGRGTFTR
jgi:hypothetical protein